MLSTYAFYDQGQCCWSRASSSVSCRLDESTSTSTTTHTGKRERERDSSILLPFLTVKAWEASILLSFPRLRFLAVKAREEQWEARTTFLSHTHLSPSLPPLIKFTFVWTTTTAAAASRSTTTTTTSSNSNSNNNKVRWLTSFVVSCVICRVVLCRVLFHHLDCQQHDVQSSCP